MITLEARRRPMPRQALLVSLLCLCVPVVSSALFPDWAGGSVGVLVWILALAPAFLLSYHRGWRGAAIGLAGAMAAYSVAQAVIVTTDATPPPWEVLFGVTTVVVFVSLGSGAVTTLLHRALERAERLALTDPGTGIPNRRHAALELEKAFAGARRGAVLSIVLFDLDQFKRVNDWHGRREGDRALARFAEILQSATRAMHVTARFGGEEFLAVLRSIPAEGAQVFADRVRRTLKELALPSGPLTVSAGIAEYETGMASPEVLLAAADQALYRAKAAGGDRVVALPKAGRRPETPTALDNGDGDETPVGRGELVLVVDDDADALRSVARALRRFGYAVLESPSPARAVEIVRGLDVPPDVVITDVVMPEMGGFRLVEILQEIQDQVRVIYTSGYAQDDVDWDGVPGAVRDYLSKPISIHTLARHVRAVLDQPARTRKLTLLPDAVPSPGRADASVVEAPRMLDGRLGREARIVVVRSESRLDDMVTRALRERGFRAVQRVDGISTLLDALHHMGAEILVLDLDLPGGALQDLADRLRTLRATSPAVLLLAGEGRQDLRTRFAELPLVDFINKPFTVDELGARVSNLARTRTYERWIGSAEERIRSRVAARTAELEEAREEVLRRLAWAAEYRDDVTGHHAERVGIVSGLIARELGWSAERRTLIEKAAPLHDLGKIAIPDAILRKPGALTPDERATMQRHTTIGGELLSGSRNPVLQSAERIALTHHEWWDGRGYPRGLVGNAIPEVGRIVAVADVWDSITNERPYRGAMTADEALDIVRDKAGTHFDPTVLEAFDRVLDSGAMREAMNMEVVARPDWQ